MPTLRVAVRIEWGSACAVRVRGVAHGRGQSTVLLDPNGSPAASKLAEDPVCVLVAVPRQQSLGPRPTNACRWIEAPVCFSEAERRRGAPRDLVQVLCIGDFLLGQSPRVSEPLPPLARPALSPFSRVSALHPAPHSSGFTPLTWPL